MKFVKPVLQVLKNKFVIATLAFAVWMTFFDSHDWKLMRARSAKYTELKESQKLLSVQIFDTKKELSLLNSNISLFEKYARENLYMKKDNEDLFIVKKP